MAVHSTIDEVSGEGSSYGLKSDGYASGMTSSNLLCYFLLCTFSSHVGAGVEPIETCSDADEVARTGVEVAPARVAIARAGVDAGL